MLVNKRVFDEISARSKKNPRQRESMDLRNSPEDVPDPYYLDKKVKMVELFPYHKLGLMNKYTHLFGDS